LYAAAFAADAALADVPKGFRYDAARCAALAARGRGLDDADRARLRALARGWLRADLTKWARVADGNPDAAASVRRMLRRCREDADLAGVRDADALEALPEAERAAWWKLWADVEALRKQLGDGK
jgi:hypothetical protein